MVKNISNYFKKSKKLRLPYIIAECGVNHEGSIKIAKKQIELAKKGGADAVKFQTYKANTLASKYSPSYWDTTKEKTRSQYELFKKHDKFWKNEFEILARHCEKNEIEFLSTPFDFESAKFLSNLVKAYKISSSDITNKPFIDYICSFKKPIILSTGASNLPEIKRGVKWIKNKKIKLALLHCILNYPTLDSNANLSMITSLKNNFNDIVIGYSDHTLPSVNVINTSYALGSEIIEKHFTHNKKLKGNDHYHSMDVNDLKKIVNGINKTYSILGTDEKKYLKSELISRKNARRSIYSVSNLKRNHKIRKEDIVYKRPGGGIPPYETNKIIGLTLKKNIKEDQQIKFKHLKI